MSTKSSKSPGASTVIITLRLEPGTEEYRAYNRIKRKYHDEMAKRQKSASDDEPCKTHLGNCEMVRGSLFALDQIDQTELPEYIDAAWKRKGRPSLNAGGEEGNEQTNSDADLNEQALLLH